MKVIRTCIDDTYISSKAYNRNFSSNSFLFLGNDDVGIFKTIITIDINEIYKINYKYKLKKVELFIYLEEIKYCSNSEEPFIIDIRKNLSDVNISTVSFATAPKINTISNRYKISKRNIGKYMNLDITYLVKEGIENNQCNFGVTLKVEEESYLVAFHSTRNKMKPFIRIYYCKEDEKTIGGNNSKCEDEQQEIYFEERMYEINNQEKLINSENSINCSKSMYKEQIMKEVEDNIKLSNDKSYGSFLNLSGKLINFNNSNNLYWDTLGCCKNIKISDDGISIIIRNKGVYKIDYYANIRSEKITTMELSQNGEVILGSSIQVGGNETPSFGNVIVNILEDFANINIIINSENIMLADMGKSASVTIVEL